MKPLPAMKNQVNQDWVAQGDKFVDAKQYADAIASYDKALAQNPLNSLAWNGKGRALYLERKYDAAIKCFDRALVINPQDHNILRNRVDVLLGQGKVDEAIQCYDKIIHANPNDKIAWNQKTCALEKLKKYEEAIGCCDELLKIDPSDIGVVIDKARMLIILRNYSEAMKCYDDILEIDPSHVEAASNKGRILVLIGKTDEALKWYDDRLATNPTMTVLHMRKGIAFAMQGQHEQALSCFDEILKINKNDKTTSVYKGISLLFLHQLQESFDHLKVAPKAKEALHVGVLALGIYNIAQKDIRIDFCDIRAYGISDYSERLLQLEYWFYRGLLFSSIKLYSDAAEAYQKLLSLDPSHVRAKKELAAILKFTAPEVLLQPDSVLEELQSHESNFIRHDQLKIKKRLASGGYGEVFLGTWSPTKLKPITVAVKQLKAEMMNAKVWKEFLQEVNIQSKLNSIGLVALLGITGEAPFYMVLEFMGKGSLRDVLIAAKIPHNLSWEERLRMASNIGIGLAYLHSQKPPVIHRDIKSLNVFVNDEGEAKLGDFGLSSAKSESQTQSLAEMNADGTLRVKGSLRWLAPELLDPALLPEELSTIRGKYTPATDIFSFATVLREMASHELPYCNAGGNENLIVYYITTGKTEKFDEVTTPNTPTEYSDLVNRCWNMNPSLRPTAEIIVKELTALSDRYNASPTLFKSKNPLKAAVKKAAPARPAPQPTKKLVAMSYMTNTRRGTVSAPAAVALDASQRKSEITLQPEGTEVAKVVLK